MVPTFINDKQGNILLNPVKRFVKGGILAPASTAVPVAAPAKSGSNNGRVAPIILQAPTDGAVEIFSLMGQQQAANPAVPADVTARARVSIQETFRGNRRFMNQSILCDHVFGTPQHPMQLPESIFLEPDQTLRFEFENGSTNGAATSFYFGCERRKFQTVNVADGLVEKLIIKNRVEKDVFYPFWLSHGSDFVTLSASARQTIFFNNTQDQWLLVWYAMATALTTGVAGDVTELFEAEWLDARTQRPLQNQPMTLNTGFGTGALPYVFPTAWLIEPESQIQCNLKNLVTDQSTDVSISLCGCAAYAHELPSMAARIHQARALPPLPGL